MTATAFAIVTAGTPQDVGAVAILFREYAASIGVDLAYQGFEAELAALPGQYAPPGGTLLLARHADGQALGCVAIRRRQDGVAEMKRLYVSPAARGLGLGRGLLQAAIAAAVAMGYRELRLDTLPTMGEAIALYRKAGFIPVAPYYDGAVAGTLYFARDLTAGVT